MQGDYLQVTENFRSALLVTQQDGGAGGLQVSDFGGLVRAATSNHQNLRVVVGAKGQQGWKAWGEDVSRCLGAVAT